MALLDLHCKKNRQEVRVYDDKTFRGIYGIETFL